MFDDKVIPERRQFPRVELNTVVNYTVVVPTFEVATTKDFSQGGVCLEVKRKLPIGTILRIEFDLPGENPEHIQALGKVIWQRQKTEDIFATGVKFLT
jgi:hypothetical protein